MLQVLVPLRTTNVNIQREGDEPEKELISFHSHANDRSSRLFPVSSRLLKIMIAPTVRQRQLTTLHAVMVTPVTPDLAPQLQNNPRTSSSLRSADAQRRV